MGLGPIIVLYTMSSDYSNIMRILNLTGEIFFYYLAFTRLDTGCLDVCHENYNLVDKLWLCQPYSCLD